jgi:Protein of unknown function (DUF2089)
MYDLILLTFNNIYLYINFVKAAATSAIQGMGAERDIPAWLTVMSEEDLQFLRRFFLSSGSLKAMAEEYGISYPTVRARLDRLIAKVQAVEDPAIADPFRRKLRLMVVDGKISSEAARELWNSYRAAWKKEGEQK